MENDLFTFGWLLLVGIVWCTTFGLLGVLYIPAYITALLGGAFIVIFGYAKKQSREELHHLGEYEDYKLKSPPNGLDNLNIETEQFGSKRLEKHFKIDKRLTGASIIDKPLQEVLQYAMRDYVEEYWYYKKISNDEEFLHELRRTAQSILVAFATRSKEVEWVPYFTRRLVDDFASHLRLYRHTRDKLNIYNRIEAKDSDGENSPSLESIFFDLELEMEVDKCRDMVCTSEEHELTYLEDISETLLFLLLSPEDFHSRPYRFLMREVLTNGVLKPLIDLYSDPDYINQTIVWLCKDTSITSDIFMTVIRMSHTSGELEAIIDKLDHEINIQRSKDSNRNVSSDDVKQLLNSLYYVRKMCKEISLRLLDGEMELTKEAAYTDENDSNFPLPPHTRPLYNLSLKVVLANNVALSYFIDFMGTVGGQGYLHFWLTIEGFKAATEQQISEYQLQKMHNPSLDRLGELEGIRAVALNVFDQYLSNEASHGISLDEQTRTETYQKIKNEQPSEKWFDNLQAQVYEILKEDKFFPAFKQSSFYVKCLAELDLLQDDTSSTQSLDMDSVLSDLDSSSSPNSSRQSSTEDLLSSSADSHKSLPDIMKATTTYTIGAHVANTAIVTNGGKSYALYMISVTRINADGTTEVWDTYRRYSDFHDLHMSLKDKLESLVILKLPGKRAFNNMSKSFLEKRQKALNSYLQTLICQDVFGNRPGIMAIISSFLEPGEYCKEQSQMARKMDTLVNPVKMSFKNMALTVKSVPGNIVDSMSDGIDKVTDGFSKMFNVSKINSKENFFGETEKVAANIGPEDDDNIPLRILLLLMDEVFDLKSRDQWLRKQAIALLRQFIKAAFGNMINSKIVDHVEWLTSAEQFAEYVQKFRDSFWPNGILAENPPVRDTNTIMRTRVAAKAKMIASIPDELKNCIGAETSRRGVLRIFDMLQNRTLNRRLVYVLLESLLETLFPDNKFHSTFCKLHSHSNRVLKKKTSGSKFANKR